MKLDRIRVTVLSAPLTDPVPMSFSQLDSRDMVLVELEADGLVGLGESWINYPSWAATERMATLIRGVAPLLAGRDVSDPVAVQAHLMGHLGGVARQWGAPGPVWQAVSAIDIALWDLLGRDRDLPVWQLLSDRRDAAAYVEAYASGVGPTGVEEHCQRAMAGGFGAVKARVGFGRERDEATLDATRATVGDDVAVFADANQAWTLPEAVEFCQWSEPYRLGWLEEPVLGNRLEDLADLSARTGMSLACGENLYGADDLARYAGSGVIQVLQPDLAKCGGFTMTRVAVGALASGTRVAPHCYGGGVVTAASIHAGAAFGDAVPYLELDIRPNPLREELLDHALTPRQGRITVPDGPGLGVALDHDIVARYTIERTECVLSAVG